LLPKADRDSIRISREEGSSSEGIVQPQQRMTR
jgi:hypothetical protein